ncbi:MAG: dual specificity protein phosphatase family protein, partial [Pseudomonadota bacterium]
PDRGLPANSKEFIELARDLAHKVQAGHNVGVHCRAGIGRSGMLCCSILYYLGIPIEKALVLVSNARGIQVPDTEAQEHWLSAKLITPSH